MDQWGAFVFFVGWCGIALIYAYIMVPETAGRALENMDALFENPWYMMRRLLSMLPVASLMKNLKCKPHI
jgi:hypothetical protein